MNYVWKVSITWLLMQIFVLSLEIELGFKENTFISNSDTISCPRNSTITIVDVNVVQYSTSCPEYRQCNLTGEESNAIKNRCYKEASCTISTIIPNSCLFNDYGHVSISYSCTEIVNISCTFENGNCGWTIWRNGDYSWKIRRGKSSQSSSGPDRDHTTASEYGYFAYTKSQWGSQLDDESDIRTGPIQANPKQCLTFWYHMYGEHINTLQVFQLNSQHNIELWSESADQGNKWYFRALPLNYIGIYRIKFKAIRGNGPKSEIAIDDVFISNTECKKVSSLDCNFDGDDCKWAVEQGSDYTWTVISGKTPDSNTGPMFDHTYGFDEGKYIYLEASKINPGQKSNFTSVIVSPGGDACFSFWFHMHGNGMGKLNVYLVSDNMTQNLWSKSGNKPDTWQLAFVDISISDPYQMTLEGVRGSSQKGDIAVDDISLLPGSCNRRAFFLDCNFEADTCNWLASSETPYIWKLTSTEDTSQADGGHYIYLEGSVSDIPEGRNSNLTSLALNPAGDICLTFWYSIQKENIGTLNVYTESENTNQMHWSQSGNKESTWQFANLTISISEPYRIVFEGILGDSDEWSYIAIDDISLLERSGSGLIKTSQTCHNIDDSISLHECSKYYLQLNETSLEFDLKFDNCSTAYHDVQTSIATLCNDLNSSDICTFDLPTLITKDQRCFRLNWLSVEYRCEDAEMTTDAAVTPKDASNAGLVVGMVIGGLLLAIAVILIVVLIRRHTFKSKQEEKIRSNLGGTDYIGSQDIALPQTANHSSHMQYFDKQTSIDDEYATVHPSSETNFNEIKENGNQTADSYMVLDPNDTGFNRTTFSHTPTGHEFSKPVKDTVHKIINDDPYAIYVEGVYDHSENNRHKELEVDIYNHAVDTFYDSGSHKRNDKGIEDTYDHFFGQKTEDDYDVSTTT